MSDTDTHKHLFFFRHGETDWNKSHRLQGHTNIPLNENGLAQAETLAQTMKKHDIGHFLASDLDRAHHTAKVVAAHHNAEVVAHPALREVTFGDAEGMHKQDFRDKYQDIMSIMDDTDNPEHRHICVPNGETRQQAIDRVLNFLHTTLPDISTQKIGIATHGALMTNIYLDVIGEKYYFSNCEIMHLYYDAAHKTLLPTPHTRKPAKKRII